MRLDDSFQARHIPCMSWEVEYTDEFGTWWDALTAAEQEDVAFVVRLLEERGPQFGYPYSSKIGM